MQHAPKKLEAIPNDTSKIKTYPKFFLESIHNDKQSSGKKLKLKKRERMIFGLIRDESSRITILNECPKEVPGSKKDSRRKKKESCFNTGRWHPEEHQRFIEALLKFGNDWKSVQRYVGSRSSTQARSHAQKFFVKIGKTQIENLQLDFENNSLKSLNIMANNLNNDQMARAIKSLNELAFDKKNSGRKNGKPTKYENPNFNKLGDEFNFEHNEREDDSHDDYALFSPGEKVICQYSTSAEHSGAFNKMTKRLRTLKKQKNCLVLKETPLQESINGFKSINVINTGIIEFSHNLYNDLDDYKPFNRLFKPSFNNILNSNRKSSIDFNYPNFNFINDNSIFVSNPYFRSSFKAEEKDFQLIFENSFKFANDKTHDEMKNYENETSAILFIDENASSNRKSSVDSINIKNEHLTDIIELFME